MNRRAFIRDILPPGSNGIVSVFESTCTGQFTYEILGPDVKYLGVGDLHDSRYDHLGRHSPLVNLNSFSARNSAYTGLPLDYDSCPITVHLYPSDDMKSDYTTRNPFIFTVAAIAIFLFTSLVFMVYDCKVERRQKLVLSSATRSTAIVSSLFPAAVRDQLYPTANEKPNNAKGRLQSFVRDDRGNTNVDAYKLSGRPIADLYPDTTVFFADIAGFTAWSAARQPTEVFHLLETLYNAFDAIATSRGVFKVETIGDSYVAVVGLPAPRKHHAIVMARFAKDCRDKMVELTRELETTLGPVRTGRSCCDGPTFANR